MIKMMMNKKAMLGREILYFFAFVFILLLLILTFFLSLLFKPGTSYVPEMQKVSNQNVVSLTAFLNTKVEVEGQNITMADLARLARMDSAYQSILKEKSEKILNPVYGSKAVLGIYSLPEFHFYVLSPDYNRAIDQIYVNIPLPQNPKFKIAFGVANND